jgi:flagellum-specific ATP synthase
MERQNITDSLDLGVRAINGLLTCGTGQRMGIMAGSGIGKSVLLGMMAKYAKADINVIALIGERGREVREFIERDLGKEGLARSVIVVVTSDQSPLLRMRGAFVATAIAEYFCNNGKNVLLMMDSVTRFAMAMREIGLAVGEPPTTKGYTPSVFATLPKLLERAGNFKNKGSITALYTVLVDGDDMTEPVADSVRSIIDGHIVLSRALAAKNHFPAIDVLSSASRVMRDITGERHQELAGKARDVLASYAEAEDLINIGAYVKGSNPKIDYALSKIDAITDFLRQNYNETTSLKNSLEMLGAVLSERKDEEPPRKNRRQTDQ